MWLERDGFEMFELLRIWSISQYLVALFIHRKAMIDNMVHNSGPLFNLICTSVLDLSSSLFCHCTLACILTPLLSSRLLTLIIFWLFIQSEFVTLVLSSVHICFSTEGSWDAPLSYFIDWYILGRSIFSSLVKVKIHMHNSWQKKCVENMLGSWWQLDQPFGI